MYRYTTLLNKLAFYPSKVPTGIVCVTVLTKSLDQILINLSNPLSTKISNLPKLFHIHSRKIVKSLIEDQILDESFKFLTTKLVKIRNQLTRLIRISFVGELGFEIHIPKSSCKIVYTSLMECGKEYNMKLAGYRALYSLSCEKGT